MAYIGRNLEQFSNVEKLDNITFTNSAGPYNLLKGAVAFTPVNAQSLLIEVDGIIQASDSYTVSGSTITFGVSMASTSTMNNIVQLGVGLISTPADGTVTDAKLATDAVTNIKVANDAIGIAELSATGTASSSNFLRGDNSWQTVTVGNITDETQTYSNFNEITADRTTTLTTTKNYFLAGTITVADTFTWTIAGSGELNII